MLYTYDANSCILTVGAIPILGLADGNAISIERNSDTFTPYVGITGEESRSKTNDRSGLAKITLMQTSPSNDYLSSLAIQDEAANAGIRAFYFKDLAGSTLYIAKQCYVMRPAAATFGKEVQTREWNIRLVDLLMFTGGNIPNI